VSCLSCGGAVFRLLAFFCAGVFFSSSVRVAGVLFVVLGVPLVPPFFAFWLAFFFFCCYFCCAFRGVSCFSCFGAVGFVVACVCVFTYFLCVFLVCFWFGCAGCLLLFAPGCFLLLSFCLFGSFSAWSVFRVPALFAPFWVGFCPLLLFLRLVSCGFCVPVVCGLGWFVCFVAVLRVFSARGPFSFVLRVGVFGAGWLGLFGWSGCRVCVRFSCFGFLFSFVFGLLWVVLFSGCCLFVLVDCFLFWSAGVAGWVVVFGLLCFVLFRVCFVFCLFAFLSFFIFCSVSLSCLFLVRAFVSVRGFCFFGYGSVGCSSFWGFSRFLFLFSGGWLVGFLVWGSVFVVVLWCSSWGACVVLPRGASVCVLCSVCWVGGFGVRGFFCFIGVLGWLFFVFRFFFVAGLFLLFFFARFILCGCLVVFCFFVFLGRFLGFGCGWFGVVFCWFALVLLVACWFLFFFWGFGGVFAWAVAFFFFLVRFWRLLVVPGCAFFTPGMLLLFFCVLGCWSLSHGWVVDFTRLVR